MTRFLKPRALYLAGLGLLAYATVDLVRRFRRSEAKVATIQPSTVQVPPAPQPNTPSPTKQAARPAGDDLTVIKGIGPTYAKRLRDAGLMTYSDIANASPEQLRDITRAAGADPSDWITAARSLNGH